METNTSSLVESGKTFTGDQYEIHIRLQGTPSRYYTLKISSSNARLFSHNSKSLAYLRDLAKSR